MRDEHPGAESFLPTKRTVRSLRVAVQTCRGCPLYKGATRAVFGAGSRDARVMLVGEQPGSSEDLAGKPFVGPAGRLLDDALAMAGIDRGDVYLTNVVKHFKYTLRGKKRIHSKPNAYEIAACKPWLGAELAAIAPDIVVLLGATAAQALLGRAFRVTKSRGVPLVTDLARYTFATVHPAAVLRAPDDEARRAAKEEFFADIAVVGDYLRRI